MPCRLQMTSQGGRILGKAIIDKPSLLHHKPSQIRGCLQSNLQYLKGSSKSLIQGQKTVIIRIEEEKYHLLHVRAIMNNIPFDNISYIMKICSRIKREQINLVFLGSYTYHSSTLKIAVTSVTTPTTQIQG